MNFAGDLLRSAGQKLAGGAKSILSNPGAASIQLFGTNVPLTPLVSFRNHFLRQLSTWSGSIPNTFQFLVLIDHFPAAVSTAMLQKVEPTGDGDGVQNNIDKNLAVTTSYLNQKVAGCIFAQGCNIPGETVQRNYAKVPKQRGFLGGLYADPRQDMTPLTLQFLETNTSFIDFVLRPWVILTGHLGLVARPGDVPENGETDLKNIKTNITIIQLAKTYQKRSSVQRKVWRFYNCAPASISEANLASNGTEMQTFNTQWYYTNYSVGGIPFIPVEEIIKNFSSGKISSIINGITQVTGVDPVQAAISKAKGIVAGG